MIVLYLTVPVLAVAKGPLIESHPGSLPESLQKIIKQSAIDKNGIGLFIQAVDTSEPVAVFQADQPLNPASVIKLVTTVASLGILGSGYRWTTEVAYTGELKNNTLHGDLYFRGNGDPYMTPERFWRLLNRVSIYGIRNISGNVYVDNSYFLPVPVDYGAFDKRPYRTYNVGPNALLVGFQATEFHFSVAKNKVDIVAFPMSPKLKIVNKVKLKRGGCGAWSKRIRLDTQSIDGLQRVVFSGRYGRDCGRRVLYRRVTEASDHFQHFFLPIWQQLGGSVKGQVTHSVLPEDFQPVLQQESISLSEAIRLINKFSNNVMTRQVLLSMGAQSYGAPGTTQKGIDAINEWLEQRNLYDSSLRLDNGAGLSRESRVSAAMLGKLLKYVYQQAYMPEFIASLPVAGYDGTMANRFKGESLQGRAHIKTGLLDDVQTMAGYVTALSGKRYVVVLLQNHRKANTAAAERLQNRLIEWVYAL